MSYYLFKPPVITQDFLETYPLFILNIISSKTHFFSSVITDWNNLDKYIRSSENLIIFKKSIPKFIRLSPNSTYNYFNTKGIKHLTRLRLGLSHLLYHKFKYGFLDSLNPISSCGFDIETTCQFLLHCPNLINVRSLLLKNISRLSKD